MKILLFTAAAIIGFFLFYTEDAGKNNKTQAKGDSLKNNNKNWTDEIASQLSNRRKKQVFLPYKNSMPAVKPDSSFDSKMPALTPNSGMIITMPMVEFIYENEVNDAVKKNKIPDSILNKYFKKINMP